SWNRARVRPPAPSPPGAAGDRPAFRSSARWQPRGRADWARHSDGLLLPGRRDAAELRRATAMPRCRRGTARPLVERAFACEGASRSFALVLPVVHQVVDHRRIRERRGVAEIAELVL